MIAVEKGKKGKWTNEEKRLSGCCFFHFSRNPQEEQKLFNTKCQINRTNFLAARTAFLPLSLYQSLARLAHN